MWNLILFFLFVFMVGIPLSIPVICLCGESKVDINHLKKKEQEAFLKMGGMGPGETKKLLQKLGLACRDVEYEEDFAWLNEAIIRWETYLKAEFGELHLAPIKKPEQELKRRI